MSSNGLIEAVKRGRPATGLIVALLAVTVICGRTQASRQENGSKPGQAGESKRMMKKASGAFEVQIQPEGDQDSSLGRMTLKKQYSGDLVGEAEGQMLTAMTETQGSAGYVAIERVKGKLDGREGSFVMQHSGTMTRGALSLTIAVVPDSGTGQLVGLTGQLNIRITDGKHFYDFEYSLPE